MEEMIAAAAEAMRITFQLDATFPAGGPKRGTAFLSPLSGQLITCAHVVVNEQGQKATSIALKTALGAAVGSATVNKVSIAHDLASLLRAGTTISPCQVQATIPAVGSQVIFSGHPQGVARPSVFPGMVSASGSGLIRSPTCEMIQIAGMVNNGNSGGPLLDSSGAVVGVICAKYVPLLLEIDKLTKELASFRPIPSGVHIMGVDFGPFSTETVQAINQVAQILRLVQVGVGWAIPAKFFSEV